MQEREQVQEILFSKQPDVRIRVINDDDPKAIKDNKKQYPFELFNAIKITIKTTKKEFSFDIPKGYTWNGADINRFLWRLIGARTDNDFLISSMIHDYMLDNAVHIINDHIKDDITIKEYIRLTTIIFRDEVKNQGTNTIKANIMGSAIHIFQLCNYKNWENKFKRCK